MKPNLIVLHGALGSKRYFAPLKEQLSNEFNILDLNFEGHGGRYSSRAFSIQVFSENLIEFLAEKQLGKITIFGYSMGGYVALNTALQQPGLISRIITLGTKFNWSPEIAEREVRMLNPEKIEEKVPKFAASLLALHEPDDWKFNMKKTANLMTGLGNGEGLTETDFQKIETQTTIGIGDEDRMVTRAESDQVANALPNANLTILPGVPHPIEMIDPLVLANYIRKELSV